MIKASYSNELYLPKIASLLLKSYNNVPKTQYFNIDNKDRFISFMPSFKYLRLLIYFFLDNNTDMENRISSASKAVEALSFIWDSFETSFEIKIKLYEAIPVNLVL